MSLVISDALVLAQSESSDGNNPLIAYDNQAVFGSVTADYENSLYPASNLTNPNTALLWKSTSSAVQYVTIDINSTDPVDYVAIERHNWGSTLTVVSIESYDGATWSEVVQETLLGDDSPALLQFTPQQSAGLRIKLQPPNGVIPQAAVVYCGKLLVMTRRIYVGHTPIPYGRNTTIVSAVTESGDFLGRIVLSEMHATAAAFSNINPTWYRQKFDPFVQQAQENPFFFAWRPGDYPREVGFAWLTADPKPTNSMSNGLMAVTLNMAAVML